MVLGAVDCFTFTCSVPDEHSTYHSEYVEVCTKVLIGESSHWRYVRVAATVARQSWRVGEQESIRGTGSAGRSEAGL